MGEEVLPLIHLSRVVGRRREARISGLMLILPLFLVLLVLEWALDAGSRGSITGAGTAWPCSVGILCKFSAFLGTLHWPLDTVDMGHFGISFLELLILFEQLAGHRFLSEKVTWPHVRAYLPVFSSVPVSEGNEIRHGCQFISSLLELFGFLPCGVGSHTSRLRHLGWNQCSLVFLPGRWNLVTISAFKAICGVLGYPNGSAAELLHGTLSLRHCTFIFTLHFLPWSLPTVGNGSGKRWYVTLGHVPDDRSYVVKMVRLTRKTRPGVSSHCNPDPGHPTLRRWKRLRPPSSEGVGGEVGGPRNLFPRLVVG